MKLVHSQWPDLEVPTGYKATSTPVAALSQAEKESIEIYIPQYMGGLESLRPIAEFPNLKVIQLLTAGYEEVVPHVPQGVRLCNARGVHDQSTAELGISLLLAHFLGIPRYIENMSRGQWDGAQRDSLYGKEIAIVGAGSVGLRLKTALEPFRTSITLFARNARENVFAVSELRKMIGLFDAVILILPLTEETRHLITKSELEKMKRGALLVNLARGPVVKTDDLVQALNSGMISAALDVTDPEPLPADHELWRSPNVIITPHVGGNSTAFEPQAREFLARQLLGFARNGELINEIAL
jgi:phosphoglycerate dehydrogenase-like enzyme